MSTPFGPAITVAAGIDAGGGNRSRVLVYNDDGHLLELVVTATTEANARDAIYARMPGAAIIDVRPEEDTVDEDRIPTRAEAEADRVETELELAMDSAEGALRAIGASVLYRLRVSPAPSAAPPLELVLRALAEVTVRGSGREPTSMTAQRFARDVLGAPARVPGVPESSIADAIVSAASELVCDHLRGVSHELISEHEAKLDEDIPF
jgi:hypothetical protein